MLKFFPNCSIAVLLALGVTACSSDDDSESVNESDEPMVLGGFSDQAPESINTGEPGGDITPIAGLWDGSSTVDEVTDVVYWNLAANGVLTRFDFQQDGVIGASGDNCYVVGEPITVSPEDDDFYSIFNVAVTAVRSDKLLTITFLDADINDLDVDGDNTETPVFSWTLLTTPVLEDLNSCNDEPFDPSIALGGNTADRPFITRAQCEADGNTILGDAGNGAINDVDFICPSGVAPIAQIMFLEDEPIATEGEVCCPS